MEKDLGRIDLHNHGIVALVDKMGSDEAIEESARISYGANKEVVKQSSQRDLLRYLFRHKHTSPFEQAEVKFYLKLPIFVMRQLVRHRTANINEISGRYKTLSDEMFVPNREDIKPQSSDNKQGRAGELDDIEKDGSVLTFQESNNIAYNLYSLLLGDQSDEFVEERFGPCFPGIAKELARIVLPLGTYTEIYWKCDLHNFFHMLKLRTDPHAQKEIRDYANAMYELAKPHFPISTEAWEDYSRDAVIFSRMERDYLRLLINSHPFALDDNFMKQNGMTKREILEFKDKLAWRGNR